MDRLPPSLEQDALRRPARLTPSRPSIRSWAGPRREAVAAFCRRGARRSGRPDRSANGGVNFEIARRSPRRPCLPIAPRRLKSCSASTVPPSDHRHAPLPARLQTSPANAPDSCTRRPARPGQRLRDSIRPPATRPRRPGVHARGCMFSTNRAGLTQTPMRRSATAASSYGTDRDPRRR
jgi:hypothetical protein